MSYDEVEIEDMSWSDELQAFTYQCPCGDLFQITLEELRAGEDIARCPSCSLFITVVYNPVRKEEKELRRRWEGRHVCGCMDSDDDRLAETPVCLFVSHIRTRQRQRTHTPPQDDFAEPPGGAAEQPPPEQQKQREVEVA